MGNFSVLECFCIWYSKYSRKSYTMVYAHKTFLYLGRQISES